MQLPIYIKNAKPNMIMGGVATGVFALFFVALAATAPSGIGRLIALPLIVVFGGLCAVFIWRYFDDRPGLVLENRGLTGLLLKNSLIPWRDIVEARMSYTSKHLCLRLRDPGQSQLGSALKGYDGYRCFNVTHLESAASLANMVQLHIARA